jgi:hypothetical protein
MSDATVSPPGSAGHQTGIRKLLQVYDIYNCRSPYWSGRKATPLTTTAAIISPSKKIK